MRASQFHIAESKIGKPRFPYNLARFAKDIAQGLYAADMENAGAVHIHHTVLRDRLSKAHHHLIARRSEYLQPYVSGKIFAHIEHKDTLLRHSHRRGL